MKKIIIKSLILAQMLFCLSCSGFLEESPKSQIDPRDLYNTEEGIVSGINGLYNSLFKVTAAGTRDAWLLSEVAADDILCSSNKIERMSLDTYTFDKETITFRNMWDGYYALIKDANVAIKYTSTSTVTNDKLKQQSLGQARFMRALAYFYLVRYWGEVPLLDENSTLSEQMNCKRIANTEIYRFLLQDLEYAENNLPDKFTGSNTGRATAGAAKALIAQVYLQLKDYNKVFAITDYLITNKAQYGYDLATNYEDNFKNPEGQDSKESVFEIQAIREKMNSLVHEWLPQPSGTGQYTINNELYKLFNNPADTRKNTFKMAKNSRGVISVFTTKYADPYPTGTNKTNGTYLKLIRYADVLLMHSEAANEIVGVASSAAPANAYTGINLVRNRAKIGDLNLGLTVLQMREAVALERRKELYFEGYRLFDLRRTDKLKEAVEAVLSGPDANIRPSVQPKHSLYPIPGEAIIANPNLLPNNLNW